LISAAFSSFSNNIHESSKTFNQELPFFQFKKWFEMTTQKGQISTSKEIEVKYNSIQSKIDIIIELDKKLIEILESIKDKKWDSLKDSRMLFIRYVAELNSNTIFKMSFQAESEGYITDKEWVKARLPHLLKQIDNLSDFNIYAENRQNNILQDTWDYFIISYFFEFETRLRSIVRNIGTIENLKSTKRKKELTGNEAFHWIYRGLYESYLCLRKSDYEVLKFFTAIRNTIHNSGIYFSSFNKEESYTYRNTTYHFKHGDPINFVSQEFVRTLLLDFLELFSKTINNSKIRDIEFIRDPIGDVKFIR
jgi:hypothetical protein